MDLLFLHHTRIHMYVYTHTSVANVTRLIEEQITDSSFFFVFVLCFLFRPARKKLTDLFFVSPKIFRGFFNFEGKTRAVWYTTSRYGEWRAGR